MERKENVIGAICDLRTKTPADPWVPFWVLFYSDG